MNKTDEVPVQEQDIISDRIDADLAANFFYRLLSLLFLAAAIVSIYNLAKYGSWYFGVLMAVCLLSNLGPLGKIRKPGEGLDPFIDYRVLMCLPGWT